MNKDLKNGLILVTALAIIGAVAVTAWGIAYAPQSNIDQAQTTYVHNETPEPVQPVDMDDEFYEPVINDLNEVVVGDACFIGGCSGQICSDVPDVMTTCEWQEQFSCYATAQCARQSSGECGWTETNELLACLSQI